MIESTSHRFNILKAALPAFAITAAMAASPMASAEETPRHHAKHVASKISRELYNETVTKGVPIKGVLNGYVTLKDHNTDSPKITYDHPVMLTMHDGFNQDGTWIGIPTSTADGHVKLYPMKIHEGAQNGVVEKIHLNGGEPVLADKALLYVSEVTDGPDQLFAFGAEGSFGGVPVTASVAK